MLGDLEAAETLRVGRRADARTTINAAVEVRDCMGEWRQAVLANLGSNGFRLVLHKDTAVGINFWLRAPAMKSLAARVR